MKRFASQLRTELVLTLRNGDAPEGVEREFSPEGDSAVIGRDWSSHSAPAASKAHSVSWGSR